MLAEKMKKAFNSINETAKTKIPVKGLTKVRVGAGWDILPDDNVDMDIAAYLCTSNGGKKSLTAKDVVYYNNKERYGATLATATTEGDDEAIDVNLSEIPKNINEIIFAISIFNAKEKRQTFRDVLNGYIRIVDTANENTLYNLDLKKYEYDECSSVIFAKLFKNSSNEWMLKKVEKGTNGDFTTIMLDIMTEPTI